MPFVLWIALLITSTLVLNMLGVPAPASGTLGFIISTVVTLAIYISGKAGGRETGGQRRSSNFYWEGNTKRCRLCQARNGTDKACYSSKREAIETEVRQRRSHGFPKQEAYQGLRCQYWHLTTTR